jgi:hypothetical protein
MSKEQPFSYSASEEQEPESHESSEKEHSFTRRFAGSRAAQALLGVAMFMGSESTAEAKKPHHHVAHHEERAARPKRAETSKTVRPDTEEVIPTKKVSLNSREDNGIIREIEAARRMNLEHFHTEADLREALESGKLVDLTPKEDDGYVIDPGLGEYAKPESRHLYKALLAEVAEQLATLAHRFYEKFHEKIHINSAVRSDSYVDTLRKNNNKNTAAGYTSTHLLGTTVDILYFGPETKRRLQEYRMTDAQKKWLRSELLKLEEAGKVYATEEKAQPCFHVMFIPSVVDESKILNLDEVAEK